MPSLHLCGLNGGAHVSRPDRFFSCFLSLSLSRSLFVASSMSQARLFAEAGVVVMVHGAAMANLAFLSEGAAVVELKQVAS